ncbi:MAG: electron transport complex protein RnfA [Clostridiaceae bacterium]|nr:electron transport complex protein RnfA [Clostridiaceae bacterium]
MDIAKILFTVILLNNIVLSQFLGVCSFLGLTTDLKNSMGMSFAVIFVMVVSSAITQPIFQYLLVPNNLEYLQTVVFILVIASAVQILEAIIKKVFPPLYKGMGIYLPLITTNCAILGIMLVNIQESYTFFESLVNGFGAGVSYMLAMFLFVGVRKKMAQANIPAFFEGVPAALVAAAIVSVSFNGFKGVLENIFGR